jgi:FkbM family methyltransferase
VDANPINGRLHRLLRPRDRVITAFCSSSEGATREFYVTQPWQYSSGDDERIKWIRENGIRVKKVIRVPTTSIEQMNVDGQLGEPSFLSIDVEGFEIEVLKGINWSLFKPTAICIESLGSTGSHRINELLAKHGYEQVANAVISRIFVLKSYGAFPRL